MDREDVQRVGIIVLEPFADFGVVGMGGVDSGFEHLVEAGNAATVCGRAIALAVDEAGVSRALETYRRTGGFTSVCSRGT